MIRRGEEGIGAYPKVGLSSVVGSVSEVDGDGFRVT